MIKQLISLEELGLSTRSYNALVREGVGTIEALTKKCVCEVMDIRIIGTNNMLEIVDKLREHNLSLHSCNKAR